MSRSQYVGIIWVVVAIIYGIGTAMIQERWFILGGAAVFAIMAVTIPIWRQWVPGEPDV